MVLAVWRVERSRIKPLTDLEIVASANKLHIPTFQRVFVRDNLPSKPDKNECGVLNLDDSLGNGTHWTTWYQKNNKNFYFDSCGIQPPRESQKYQNGTIRYSTEKIQPKGEVFCGHLCLYVLKQLSLGRHLQNIINGLH